ncbi:hypothetical protein QVD17_07142 [Tagetes erecta]|uniref:HAT C-terminal dimerisation domain-containing protein n=1 Tax=Tagetes erecta TaxID=13708 RepID=A0AAD8LPU7_TARER|nr:hypothetical protein QVD17_07142 [Tagetes erecta]
MDDPNHASEAKAKFNHDFQRLFDVYHLRYGPTTVTPFSQSEASSTSESAFSTSGRVISLRRTRLSPEAVEMCICLKDHLDAIDRKQHLTSLEDDIEPEAKIHDEEVEEGLSTGISDEELKEDEKRRGKK